MENILNPYVPNLGPGVTIPGLSEADRARLYELVSDLVNGPDRLKDRITSELYAAQNLAAGAHRSEWSYVALLTSRTNENDRRAAVACQAAQRCKHVAEVLTLWHMYVVRKKLSMALGAELLKLKAKSADLPDEHPLLVLMVGLTVLVSKFGRGRPEDALQYLNGIPKLPANYAMDTVQEVFEEISLSPGADSEYLATSNISVPFIEKGDACGVELLLQCAVRDAKKAQNSCKELGVLCADYLDFDDAEFAQQLEKALRNKDQKAFERIKQAFADNQACFFARAADLRNRLSELKKARLRLGQALIDSKHAIRVDYTLSVGSPEGLATVTAAINCISAHRLWLDIGNDKRCYEEKLEGIGKTTVSLKNYIDNILQQVVASPVVSSR